MSTTILKMTERAKKNFNQITGDFKMKKQTICNGIMTAAFAVVFVLTAVLPAQGQDTFHEWTDADSADSLWDNDGNWTDVSPVNEDSVVEINAGAANPATLDILASGDTGSRPDTASSSYYFDDDVRSDVTGKTWDYGQTAEVYIGTLGNTGVLNIEEGGGIGQRRGTTGGEFHLGVGNGSEGTINQSGGALITRGDAGDVHIGTGGGTGTWNFTGGYYTDVNDNAVKVGTDGGTGLLKIAGGRFEHQGHFEIGSGGTLRVEGSASDYIATTLQPNETSPNLFKTGSTLQLRIDDTQEGITPIEAIDGGEPGDPGYYEEGGNVAFESGAQLDVDWLGDEVSEGGTWTVMTWEGDLAGGSNLEFHPDVDESIWSYDINTGNSGSLTVTAVPEPSSLLLLGIAGLLLMKRRRV